MFRLFTLLTLCLLLSCQSDKTEPKSPKEQKLAEWTVVIHGGAGGLQEETLSKEQKKKYLDGLNAALMYAVNGLEKGKTAIEIVESGIMMLEDNPIFNAGKGSVLNSNGIVEMDASIMDGKTLDAGAIAGTKRVKNPIKAANRIKDSTKHVMFSADAADEWAIAAGLETMPAEYFITEKSQKTLQFYKDRKIEAAVDENKGTVGFVVLDKYGNLAAGTSTGGMTNKENGRVGDSPIIGAGTYADNKTCAVSCTGHGEKFIRLSIAYSLSAIMKYTDLSLQSAVDTIMQVELKSLDGDGGLIAVNKRGEIGIGFNTSSMLRAWANPDSSFVGIFE